MFFIGSVNLDGILMILCLIGTPVSVLILVEVEMLEF